MSRRKGQHRRSRQNPIEGSPDDLLEKHAKDIPTYAAYFVLLFRLLVLFSRAIELPFHT